MFGTPCLAVSLRWSHQPRMRAGRRRRMRHGCDFLHYARWTTGDDLPKEGRSKERLCRTHARVARGSKLHPIAKAGTAGRRISRRR
jgi:hypothetical protein